MEFLSLKKSQRIILLAVFTLAIFLIVFHFMDTPRVWVDEGVFTEAAKNLAWHGVLALQTEPGQFFPMTTLLTTGYPVIFPVAASFYLFGTGIWQARLPMIVFMFLLVVFFYLFAKKRYGFRAAILSVLMLISFSPFYGNGRPVQGEVPGLAFIMFGAWFLLLWEESGFTSNKWTIAAGLGLGLALATKPTYLFLLGAALLVSLALAYKKIIDKKKLALFAGSLLMPLLFLVFIQFPSKEALLNAIPTYLHLAGNHGSSVPITETIYANFIKFFTESTPLLFSFLAVIVFAAFLLRFLKKKGKELSSSELLLGFFVIFNWLAYLIGTGWYRYFFPAHALLYALFPGALLVLSEFTSNKTAKRALWAIPILLIAFQFFHLVFLSDTSFTVKRTRNAEFALELSGILPAKKVLFYNTVDAIIFLPSDNYSQYLIMGDFLEAGNRNALKTTSADYILADTDLSLPPGILCYDKKYSGKYYLFERNIGCKNK